jgi:hexosaminidase
MVPELDMPAHAASWAHAEPSAVVQCPTRVSADAEGLEHGMDKAALHPLSERTYELIDLLLTELAELFPDEYMHIGGDEVDGECWLEDGLIREWAQTHGLAWKEQLVAKFSARVLRRVAALGKRAVLWDEALEMAPHLPASFSEEGATPLTIDAWRDWQHLDLGGGKRVERWMSAPAAGHQVVWSSLSWYASAAPASCLARPHLLPLTPPLPLPLRYLDLPANNWESMYSLQLPTMPPATFLGGEASGWSESADPTNMQQRSLTRLAAAAELLWSGTPSELAVAKQRLASVRCRLLRRGLQAEPVIPDHCAVPARAGGLAASLPATPPHEAAPAVGAAMLGRGAAIWPLVAMASLAVNAILLCAMLLPRWCKTRAPSGRGTGKKKAGKDL